MAAHKNLFSKVLSFVKSNGLEYEVSYATSTSSSYLTIYVCDTTGDWAGEMRCRFSDHATPNIGFHTFDSFLKGNKFGSIKELLYKAVSMNGMVEPGNPYFDI
jgi:hypothetical protein